jgi:serine/threonine protein kinase, bacterial
MRNTTILFGLVIISALLACKGNTDRFGAIAISASTGKFGGAINHASQADAQKAAADQCGVADCKDAIVWFKNSCVAIAHGKEKDAAFGSQPQPTQKGAEDEAMAKCAKNGNDCTVAATFCTDR